MVKWKITLSNFAQLTEFSWFRKKNRGLFEEYKNHPDESVRKRAGNWAVAIGLQRVDGLNVSDFLIEVARQEIEGKITMDEAQAMIDEHYAQMYSNRSSYEIVPPDSKLSQRIAEYNRARRPGMYEWTVICYCQFVQICQS